MKAVTINNFNGDINSISLIDAETPIPAKGEVLVRVYASTVNSMDSETLHGKWKSAAKKAMRKGVTVTGLELSGVVASNGQIFSEGDRVFGYVDIFKGCRAHAEFVAFPEEYLAIKPGNVSHEEAAVLPIGMLTSLQALANLARIKEGQHVLISGASGGVGVYAVQLAKLRACRVTAVDSSGTLEFLSSLGTDRVLDYKHDTGLSRENQYDVIFDVAGNLKPRSCKKALRKAGVFVTTNPLNDIVGILMSPFASKKSKFLLVSKPKKGTLDEVRRLVETGNIKPIIDRVYRIGEIKAAFRRLEESGRKGRIAISMP
jgi:NADPH:quinone reductase-like Zn-dependent oxidoreductase